MTEKEKMLRGMLYDADDSALCADRVRAKELCHAYNQLRPSDAAGMRELLQQLLGKTGETFCVTAPFWCDYGYNIRLGEHFYANHNLVILDCAAVTIGADSLLGPNIGLYAVNHATDAEARIHGACWSSPIHIGRRVWLGGDVKVLAGVTIGDDTIIGAGSVVTKDIPSGVIAAGNPCRVLRVIGAGERTERERQELEYRK